MAVEAACGRRYGGMGAAWRLSAAGWGRGGGGVEAEWRRRGGGVVAAWRRRGGGVGAAPER